VQIYPYKPRYNYTLSTTLSLDHRQQIEMETYLHQAWLFGIRPDHAAMVDPLRAHARPAATQTPTLRQHPRENQIAQRDRHA
jgi:hypothetical protein